MLDTIFHVAVLTFGTIPLKLNELVDERSEPGYQMKTFTKESLIAELMAISSGGWVESCRAPGNDGAVGNTLEGLLGITENNLPLPNAAEWEIKG